MPDYPNRPFLWPGARAHELPADARMAHWYNNRPGSAYTLDIFVESGTLHPEDAYLVVWLPEWTPEPEPAPDDPDAELVEIIARAISARAGDGMNHPRHVAPIRVRKYLHWWGWCCRVSGCLDYSAHAYRTPGDAADDGRAHLRLWHTNS